MSSSQTPVENPEYAAFAQRVIRSLGKRIGDGDIDGLPDLLALHDLVDEQAARAVEQLRGAPHFYSWQQIADRLGVTRQAAMQRWPRREKESARQPGGQPSDVR